MARLRKGIFVNNKETFGTMQFCALWREKMEQKEDGTVGEKVEERYYDLMCENQGCMVRVGIPGDVPLKEFAFETNVELVNPTVGTVANATFNGADVDWYVKADDIVPANASAQPAAKPDRASDKQPKGNM